MNYVTHDPIEANTMADTLDDIFAVQDEITETIVASLVGGRRDGLRWRDECRGYNKSAPKA